MAKTKVVEGKAVKAVKAPAGPSVNRAFTKTDGRGLVISTFLSHFTDRYSVRINEFPAGFTSGEKVVTKSGKERAARAPHQSYNPKGGPYATFGEAELAAQSLVDAAIAKGWVETSRGVAKKFVGDGVPD